MTDVEERVWQEVQRFNAALPRLLAEYEGKWVVFKDGKVTDAFDDEEEAYAAGIERFGPRGEFVLRQVKEDTGPVFGHAGFYFGVFST